MPRLVFLCVILSLCIVAEAQDSKLGGPLPLQVVYVMDGSTITTYDIDPQTLQAKQVGTLLMAPANFPSITTGLNGHYLYYSAEGETGPHGTNRRLLVYATDQNGAPQNPPVQEIGTTNSGQLLFLPNTNFLYLITTVAEPNLYTLYTIWRYLVDPATGKLSQPQAEATYNLPTDGSAEYCGIGFVGSNTSGTELYDEVGCSTHDSDFATYYERTINLQTGALGPDQEIYAWNNGDSGGTYVQFVRNLLFVFDSPNDFQQGINSVDIYGVATGTQPPIVQCAVGMLEACGYSGGVAHPSGKYVFMGISPDLTQIEKVELTEKKIVDTGNYIPYSLSAFSPDGSIVYSYSFANPGYILEIYGFDVATSNVTPGGGIFVPSGLDPYFVAERYQ